MSEPPAMKLVDIEMALLMDDKPFHVFKPALPRRLIPVEARPHPPLGDSSYYMAAFLRALRLVIIMIKPVGIHGVPRMRFVVDGEVGSDKSMIGEKAVRDLLPPLRRFVIYGFAKRRGRPKQAAKDAGSDRNQAWRRP